MLSPTIYSTEGRSQFPSFPLVGHPRCCLLADRSQPIGPDHSRLKRDTSLRFFRLAIPVAMSKFFLTRYSTEMPGVTIHVHHYLGPDAMRDYHFWLLPPSTSYVHPWVHEDVSRTRIQGASRGNDVRQVHVRIVDNLGRTASVCIRHEENSLILRGNLAAPGERVVKCSLTNSSRWSRVDRYVGIHLRADGMLALQGLRDCDWETENGSSREVLIELPAFRLAQVQAQPLVQEPDPPEDQHRDQEPPPYTGE